MAVIQIEDWRGDAARSGPDRAVLPRQPAERRRRRAGLSIVNGSSIAAVARSSSRMTGAERTGLRVIVRLPAVNGRSLGTWRVASLPLHLETLPDYRW